MIKQIEAYEPYNEQEARDKEIILSMLTEAERMGEDIFSRENRMAHMTASAWVVNRDRTKVLLAYHNIYNSWAWLGGHADGEEDLLRVALREANEESGIVGARPLRNDIFSLEILGVDGHVKRGRYVATHLHLNCTYLLEADDRLPIRAKADENSAVRWIPFADVEAEVRELEMRVVYRKLMDKAGC